MERHGSNCIVIPSLTRNPSPIGHCGSKYVSTMFPARQKGGSAIIWCIRRTEAGVRKSTLYFRWPFISLIWIVITFPVICLVHIQCVTSSSCYYNSCPHFGRRKRRQTRRNSHICLLNKKETKQLLVEPPKRGRGCACRAPVWLGAHLLARWPKVAPLTNRKPEIFLHFYIYSSSLLLFISFLFRIEFC